MKPKNAERQQAKQAGELTFTSKTVHRNQRTGEVCGTFERYTNSGCCVHCAKSKRKLGDELAMRGEKVMTRDMPAAERMSAAIECYRTNSDVSIARCSHLYSVSYVPFSKQLKALGLTRPSRTPKEPGVTVNKARIKINHVQAVTVLNKTASETEVAEFKANKLARMAMVAFARPRLNAEKHREVA